MSHLKKNEIYMYIKSLHLINRIWRQRRFSYYRSLYFRSSNYQHGSLQSEAKQKSICGWGGHDKGNTGFFSCKVIVRKSCWICRWPLVLRFLCICLFELNLKVNLDFVLCCIIRFSHCPSLCFDHVYCSLKKCTCA